MRVRALSVIQASLVHTPWTVKPSSGLLCPWELPGTNTGGCHVLLQIFQPRIEPAASYVSSLRWQVGSLPLAPPEAHSKYKPMQIWILSPPHFEQKCLFYPQQCLLPFSFLFFTPVIYLLKDWLWWVPLPQTLFPWQSPEPTCSPCPKVTSQPWFPWPPCFKCHSHTLNSFFFFLMTVITL